MTKISTFEDWIDYFRQWQKDIGYDPGLLGDYKFETKLGELHTPEIEFGDFKGQRKWERIGQIPNQSIRDALMNLIVYQGDTEFASVEQQRHLLETAPTDYDLDCLARVMCEEMRHGVQMSHILVSQFGHSGRIEAQKLLERHAFYNQRLLGSFNLDVRNWLDFFVYTQFIDRDGKFQLKMLSFSAFIPLAQSMGPMLKEESFHLGTGNNGLLRILKAGKIPTPVVQRYFNKWICTAFDLFGKDGSATSQWAYEWGLKGRYDEDQNTTSPDREQLNAHNRDLYRQECVGLVEKLNRLIPADQPKLAVPDIRFNRAIGTYAGQRFTVTGEPVEPSQYESYLASQLPTPADEGLLAQIFQEPGWIAPRAA
jgi:benzoyl-CoA 2,3-dioxygenase component B